MMYQEAIQIVLSECESALCAVPADVTEQFIEKLLAAKRVFFIGVGRVLLSLQAMAKRFAHLGIETHIVGEITEPALQPGDLLVVGSGSGETLFPREIAKKAKTLGACVIMIGSNRESTIARLAELMIRVPTNTKLHRPDEITSQQIMTSLFEQFLLLYGDIVAKMIVQKRQIDPAALWQYHSNLE